MANRYRTPSEAERRRDARKSLVERISAYVAWVRDYRRQWAPVGGGGREVGRRRRQLEAGTLRTNSRHFVRG